jgi:hypothetical protein
MSLSLRNTNQEKVVEYYLECHGPDRGDYSETIDQWMERMIDMLGPDDCQFIIRSRMQHLLGMWVGAEPCLWHPNIACAVRFSWIEAAAKCSNHKRLEAVRIINDKEAEDSKGRIIKIEPFKPFVPVVEQDEPEIIQLRRAGRMMLEGDLPVVAEEDTELDRMQTRAIKAAEDEGMPPMDEVGPGEAQHLIELDPNSGIPLGPGVMDGGGINPYSPFYTETM